MPVLISAALQRKKSVCMYIYRIYIRQFEKTPDNPILVLDNQQKTVGNHSTGVFFATRASGQHFEFKEEDETFRSNILRIDARFVNLIKWQGRTISTFFLSGETGQMAMRCTRSGKMLFTVERNSLRRMDFCSM